MTWLHLVSYFFGGIFLANFIPHFVSGTMGRALPNSLRKASRRRSVLLYGERSVGFFNAVAGYLLVVALAASI